MQFVDLVQKYQLAEAILEGISFANHLRDVQFEFELGEMNVRDGVEFPRDGRLTIVCKDYIRFRVTRDPKLMLFCHPLDLQEEAQVGRKTVVSVTIECPSQSLLLQELGEAAIHFQHLTLETMDGLFEVVFKDLDLR